MNQETLSTRIRNDFPALQRQIEGRSPAYFDGPAGSQVPRQVIDAVADYLANHNANTGGAFTTSVETDAIIEGAREWAAAFLGSGSSREVVFGANMTSLTFALSRSLSRTWAAGDEVIVTELDHQANIAPWRMAAEERGVTVKVVPFHRESCTLDLEAYARLLTPRTRLVAVGYASNAVGTVNDVTHVATLARQVGALTFVDAVHRAPHGLLDVEAIGCDFLSCSAYKFFGPHVGILWGRNELLTALTPYRVPPSSNEAPGRWETGTLNHEGIAGTGAAIRWIASLARGEGDRRERVAAGMQAIEGIEGPLLARLLDGLSSIPGVRVHGPPRGHPRTPTVAMTLEGEHPSVVAETLASEGIFVWAGDFYAPSVIAGLGLAESGGVVRIGLAPYNTAGEVDRLLEGVERCRAAGSRGAGTIRKETQATGS
jgi:cysteine desulfurase family protein (TIGR01976 family)